ncbi:hypothetical protein A9X00_28075 [Mycobacterium sp. 1245805.9]|nr:hypothetical protein A9X00_28075 [Mycobacterium sp. 1245805.9]
MVGQTGQIRIYCTGINIHIRELCEDSWLGRHRHANAADASAIIYFLDVGFHRMPEGECPRLGDDAVERSSSYDRERSALGALRSIRQILKQKIVFVQHHNIGRFIKGSCIQIRRIKFEERSV